MPVRGFIDAVDDLVDQVNNGNPKNIPYKDIKEWCIKNKVSQPAPTYHMKYKRGKVFDLSALYKNPNKYNRLPAAADSNEEPLEFDNQGELVIAEPPPELTDAELLATIEGRFDAMDMLAYGVVNGDYPAMIVTGNPGIGKTYSLDYILEGAAQAGKITYEPVRGYVRATGLFRLLWANRFKGSVLLLDDADSVFNEEIGLNLLKAALDTTKKRTISWRSEKVFECSDGEPIPESFEYEGSIIFITNIDMERKAASDKALAPHMNALMSRSFYVDLNMHNHRELMLRIRSVVKKSDILKQLGISKADSEKIVNWMDENRSSLRELSLRAVLKLGMLFKPAASFEDFAKMAAATCIRRG